MLLSMSQSSQLLNAIKHRSRHPESSNINEVIRAVLNFLLIFFYEKILHAQKSQKALKSTKSTKSTKTLR